MLRKLLFAVFLSISITVPVAQAQGPPQGQAPAPQAQGQGRPPSGGLRPDGSPNRGRQQPPPDLPTDVVNAPQNGPGARLAPGVNIPVPRNQDEARQIQEQYRPQLQAASDAARGRREAANRLTQRVRAGDRSLPTTVERGLGNGYGPTQQRAVPPRRSDSPVEQVMKLLTFANAQPVESPEAEPDAQSATNACAVYSLGWMATYGYDDWLVAESLNICDTNILPLYRIDHLNNNMHAYRCSWYFSWADICMAPQYWATFWPYCDLYGAHSFQWCGPNFWEPEYFGAGYFVRSWGSVVTVEGLFGYAVNDSANIAYHCDPYHWSSSCS